MMKSNIELLQRIQDNDPELKVVFFVGEQCPGLECIKELVDVLNKNKIVTSLCLDSNYIDDECAVELGRIRCPTLKDLSMQNNNLSSKGVIEIAKIPHLTIINLSYNGIDDEGALALSSLASLEKLNISVNKIGNKGLIALLNNTSIRKLKIEDNAFDKSGLQHVFNNSTLFSIKARNNEISREYHQTVIDHISAKERSSKCVIL